MDRETSDGMESVGAFRMHVTIGERTPSSEDRWKRRAELLAAWLVEQWRDQVGKEARHESTNDQ